MEQTGPMGVPPIFIWAACVLVLSGSVALCWWLRLDFQTTLLALLVSGFSFIAGLIWLALGSREEVAAYQAHRVIEALEAHREDLSEIRFSVSRIADKD